MKVTPRGKCWPEMPAFWEGIWTLSSAVRRAAEDLHLSILASVVGAEGCCTLCCDRHTTVDRHSGPSGPDTQRTGTTATARPRRDTSSYLWSFSSFATFKFVLARTIADRAWNSAYTVPSSAHLVRYVFNCACRLAAGAKVVTCSPHLVGQELPSPCPCAYVSVRTALGSSSAGSLYSFRPRAAVQTSSYGTRLTIQTGN